MLREFKVLIVDDHPLISEAYKSAFSHLSASDEQLKFKIDVANNCDVAIEKIIQAKNEDGIDIIFLDIKLPPSKDNQILSGEDIGIKIRSLLPKAKIIISTTFNNNYRIHSIFKSLNPEGFLIKNDITSEEILSAIKTIINDPPYYSQTVIKLLRKQVSNDLILDKTDRILLHELSVGTRMKDLPSILHLSIGGVEKRKRHLKDVFNLNSESDKELVSAAKEKGFI